MTRRVAIITGGAGAIGRAIANAYAASGIYVGLFDNRADALNEFASEMSEKFGDRVLGQQVDIRHTDQIEAGFDKLLVKFGKLDILVNNAAVTQVKPIDEIKDEDIDNIIDTDLKGYIRCTRRAAGIMKQAGNGGNILMVSSKNGLEGAAEKCLYSAAKGGILTLARALAKELGQFGIRVNSICPDAVIEGSHIWRQGGEYRQATAKRYGLTNDQIPDYYRNRCALKQTIKAEDIRAAALFLVSEGARAITGTILPVDGGLAFVR